MATTFSVINREVAQSLNALAGAQVTTREAAYTTAPITSGGVGDSPIFNPSFIFDRALDVQGQIAQEICNQRTHPWRSHFASTISGIANNTTLPTLAANSKTIIGVLGEVTSAGIPQTWVSWEEMRLYLLHTSNLFTSGPGVYTIQSNRIYCSNSTVDIMCCAYERADYSITSTIALSDVVADTLVVGTLAQILVEGMYLEQASYFSNIYQAAIEAIRSGAVVMPAAPPTQKV